MRKYLFAAVAAVAVATPAAARDGAGYFGIEGGILFPKDQDANLDATFVNSAQTPAAGTDVPTLPAPRQLERPVFHRAYTAAAISTASRTNPSSFRTRSSIV